MGLLVVLRFTVVNDVFCCCFFISAMFLFYKTFVMFWKKNFVQEKSADWSETESDCAGE